MAAAAPWALWARGDDAGARAAFAASAEATLDADALFGLGWCQLRGYGQAADVTSGEANIADAARRGHEHAVAIATLRGLDGRTAVPAAGVALLERIAARGDPWALFELAEVFANGDCGVVADLGRAVPLYEDAARRGHMQAAVFAALARDKGVAVPRDRTRAVELLTRAANAGNAMAQKLLADRLVQGDVAPRDPARAFTLYERAGAQGFMSALVALATHCQLGVGLPAPDTVRARLLFFRSNAGDMDELALAMARSDGVVPVYVGRALGAPPPPPLGFASAMAIGNRVRGRLLETPVAARTVHAAVVLYQYMELLVQPGVPDNTAAHAALLAASNIETVGAPPAAVLALARALIPVVTRIVGNALRFLQVTASLVEPCASPLPAMAVDPIPSPDLVRAPVVGATGAVLWTYGMPYTYHAANRPTVAATASAAVAELTAAAAAAAAAEVIKATSTPAPAAAAHDDDDDDDAPASTPGSAPGPAPVVAPAVTVAVAAAVAGGNNGGGSGGAGGTQEKKKRRKKRGGKDQAATAAGAGAATPTTPPPPTVATAGAASAPASGAAPAPASASAAAATAAARSTDKDRKLVELLTPVVGAYGRTIPVATVEALMCTDPRAVNGYIALDTLFKPAAALWTRAPAALAEAQAVPALTRALGQMNLRTSDGVFWLKVLVGVGLDRPLLVYLPELDEAYTMRVDGVPDVSQLTVLLADALAEPLAQVGVTERPNAAMLALARGEGPQHRHAHEPGYQAHFRLYPWQAYDPACGRAAMLRHLWAAPGGYGYGGLPVDFLLSDLVPIHDHWALLLQGPNAPDQPTGARPVSSARSFDMLRAELRNVKRLSTEETATWRTAIAQHSAAVYVPADPLVLPVTQHHGHSQGHTPGGEAAVDDRNDHDDDEEEDDDDDSSGGSKDSAARDTSSTPPAPSPAPAAAPTPSAGGVPPIVASRA
jgi:TPR repeat protein